MSDIFEDIHAMLNEGAEIATPSTVVETPIPAQTNQTIETPKVAENPVETTDTQPEGSTQTTEVPTSVESPKAEVPVESVKTPEVVSEPDYAKFLDEKSGGKVKSVEDLQRILSDYENAQAQLQDPNVEFAKKLSAWEESGRPAELFHAIQQVDTDELSVDDVIKLKIKLDNPEWNREDIELYVERKYNQDADGDEKTIKYGQLMMKNDAATYLKELNGLKEMTFVKNDRAALQAAAEKAENDRKGIWRQNLPNMVNSFNEVTIPIDNKGENYKWTVTPEQKRELQSIMENIVMQAPVNFDDKGISAVEEVMKKEFINRNFNQIAKGISTHISSKKTEEKIVEIHNPTGAKTPQQPVVVDKKSADDELFDNILKMEGISNRR